MKKIKIPFSLEEYNKGEYVVETRREDKVRLICTDLMNNSEPVIAAIYDKHLNRENIFTYATNGKYCHSYGEDSEYDLYLIKQEFEDGDIVITPCYGGFFILPYRGTSDNGRVLTEVYYYTKDCTLNYHDRGCNCGCGYTKNCRLADEKEKNLFISKLLEENKKKQKSKSEEKQVENVKQDCILNPFDKVLVRNTNEQDWRPDFFRKIYSNPPFGVYCFNMIKGISYKQCIPYNDETKCLIETSEDCPDKYKTW